MGNKRLTICQLWSAYEIRCHGAAAQSLPHLGLWWWCCCGWCGPLVAANFDLRPWPSIST